MENKSLWLRFMRFTKSPPLEEDIDTDILIVGGGMAGLNTAYFLMNSGKKIVLIDKDTCGKGVSAHTTGKLTYLQEDVYHKIKKNYDEKTALQYLESQKEAIRLLRTIVTKNKIDCDLDNTTSYIFTNELDKISSIKKEEEFFQKNHIRLKTGSKLPIHFPSLYTLKSNISSFFHPVKYMLELKKILLRNSVSIYEDTRATCLERKENSYIVTAGEHKIKASYVVVCTHYPFFITPFFTPFKTTVERSYIVSSIVNHYKKMQAISLDNPIYSFRYHQDKKNNYLIFLSNSHSIQTQYNSLAQYHDLFEKYKTYFNGDIKYYWTNHDVMTYDHLPLIGKLDDHHLMVMTGFNTWGMTNSVIGAKVIRDIILEKENEYISLFSPKRSISIDKVKNLLLYNFSASKSYLFNKISPNHSFYKEDVYVFHKEGKSYGIYIDKKGKKHMVYNTCPHMKCSLIFNYIDKTWDCPCHASRFDMDGHLLYGPSVFDISVTKEKSDLTDI